MKWVIVYFQKKFREHFFFLTYKSHQFANFKISSTQEVEISKYQAVLNQKEIRKKTEQNE
jgi:hypothetical protein